MQNVEPKHTFVESIFKIGPVARSGPKDDMDIYFLKSSFWYSGDPKMDISNKYSKSIICVVTALYLLIYTRESTL